MRVLHGNSSLFIHISQSYRFVIVENWTHIDITF